MLQSSALEKADGSNPLDAESYGASTPVNVSSTDRTASATNCPSFAVPPSSGEGDSPSAQPMNLPPLSNASIALAEFASLLPDPDSAAGNQYLKEHIAHLLSNVDSSNTLVTVARALELAQVNNDGSNSSPGGTLEESAHSDSRMQTTTSTFPGQDTAESHRQSRQLGWATAAGRRRSQRGGRWESDLVRRRSTFGYSQTETESHLDESSKTHDEPVGSPHSTDLMMGDNGSILDEQPQLFSSLIGGSMSAASASSSAAMVDPLEQESPFLPKAVRLEGRRAAVSAIPSGLLSMSALGSGLGTSLANASTTSRTGSRAFEPVTAEETERLTALVKASHLFSSLEAPELAEVVRAMRKESYPAGTAVLEQGQDSRERLFLIFEGTCEAIKQGKSLAAMQAGATFGELELMYKQLKCAATIRCVTNCVFFTLGEEAYHRAVMHDSVQKRRRFQQLTESAPFLRCLPQYERNKVAEALHTVQFKKGQRMIRFGEKGSHMYFIMEGEVKVVGRHQGHRVEVVRLHKGDVLGELEFLFNHLSVADVIVVSRRLRAARISREHFELIVGPIHDRLKEFIAMNPTYEKYYVKNAADESVRSELSRASSTQRLRPRRVESVSGRAESLTLLNVDPEGEMVISAPVPLIGGDDGDDGVNETASEAREGDGIMQHEVDPTEVAQRAFRFPLAPVTRNRWVLIGLREDGLILTWNKMCEKLTAYSAAEVVGQNIYSLLLEAADQKAMYHAIARAKKYAGTVEDFGTDLSAGRRRKYTIARSDGLTKAVVELAVLPPVMSRGCDATPEMVLAIGEEVSQGPQKALDQTHWLSKQVRLILADGELTYEDRLQRIAETLANYEDVYRAMTLSTERLRVVNIHQMMGVVIMDFAVQCVQKRIAVCQRFEGLPSERAYLDAELLPQCLRYAMHTTTQFNENCQLTITVTVTEKSNLEFLVINFNVAGGSGFPEVYEEYVNRPLDDPEDEAFLTTVRTSRTTLSTNNSTDSGTMKQVAQLRRVRQAVEQQGGTIRIQQAPPDTANILFLIPFMAAEDDAGETTADGVFQPNVSMTNTESAVSLPTGDLLFAGGTSRSSAVPVGETAAPPVEDGPSYNFTTLVAEDTPAHRNMLCAYLWERRHAVLPAYSLADIERLSGVADILLIDLQQSIMSSLTTQDPIALLREKARQMAVIITATDFDVVSAETYQKAGFITLKKPCTPVQALQAIRKAEDKIAAVKQEAERIAKTRETLAMNSRGAWKRGALLGKGSFGEVYEAIDILTGGKMAVKELRLGGQNNVKVENFVDEVATMCNLQHPNIIHYFYCEESMEGANKVFRVFMEFAAGGTLQGLRTKKGKLPFAEFQRLLHDVTEGLAYIHSQHYVHSDIKTANVLLGHDEKGKIGDFGTARRIREGELLYDMQGSPLYMSPECMSAGEVNDEGERIGYSYPTDIWSLGCVVLEMVTGKPPFSHIKKFNGPAGFTNFITSLSDTPDLSPLFSEPPAVTEFVSACLKPDPAERATAQDLLRMSVFSESADEDTKSAVKALSRAQLLHVLNKFVAFQDPEEVQEKERQKNQFVTRHRSLNDFFASSSSSSSSSGGSSGGGSARVRNKNAPDGKPGTGAPKSRQRDFFSSSSESGSEAGSAAAAEQKKPTPPARVTETALLVIDYTPTDFPPRRKSFRACVVGSHRSSASTEQEPTSATGKPGGDGAGKSWAEAAHRAAHEATAAAHRHETSSEPGAAGRPHPANSANLVSAAPVPSERGSSGEPDFRVPGSPEDEDLSPTPKKRSRTRARDDTLPSAEPSSAPTAAPAPPSTTSAARRDGTPLRAPTVAAAHDAVSPHAPSNGTSWERSSSRHHTHGSDGRAAAPPYLTNASFVNFSFNRNVSFMGANMNDVLNSVANEFMNNLAGFPGGGSDLGSHCQPESVREASAASLPSAGAPVEPTVSAGSAQVSAHARDGSDGEPAPLPSESGAAEGQSVTASTSANNSRPAIVKAWLQKKLKLTPDAHPPPVLSNRSFFMVQELDNTRLGASMRGSSRPRGGFDNTVSTCNSVPGPIQVLKPHSVGTAATTATTTEAAAAPSSDAEPAPPMSFLPNAVVSDRTAPGEAGRRAPVVVAPPPPPPPQTLHLTDWGSSSSDESSGSREDRRKPTAAAAALLTDEALRLHRASFTESSDAVQQLFIAPALADSGCVAAASGSRNSLHGNAAASMMVRVETELQSIAGRLKHLLEERVSRARHTDPLSPPVKPAPPRRLSEAASTPKTSTSQHLCYVLPVSAVQPTGSAPLSAALPSSNSGPNASADGPGQAHKTSAATGKAVTASAESGATSAAAATAEVANASMDSLKGDMEGLLEHVERLQSFVADQRSAAAVLSPSSLEHGSPLNGAVHTLGESQLLAALQKYDRGSD